MRCAKLKGGAIVASDRHTERAMKTPNADAERTEHNLRLRGEKGDDLKQKIESVIADAQAQTRKGFAKMQSNASSFSSAHRPNILKNL